MRRARTIVAIYMRFRYQDSGPLIFQKFLFCIVLFFYYRVCTTTQKTTIGKKWSNLGNQQVEGKGGVIPLPTWQPLLEDEVTCPKIHRIPYRWIAPGVSQAFLTKPQKNGSTAQVLRGTNGRYDNLFFLRKKRWGALANTKSLATKFRGNDIYVQTRYSFFYLSVSRPFLRRNVLGTFSNFQIS